MFTFSLKVYLVKEGSDSRASFKGSLGSLSCKVSSLLASHMCNIKHTPTQVIANGKHKITVNTETHASKYTHILQAHIHKHVYTNAQTIA